MQEKMVFVTEQEKLFYQLGQHLGALPHDLQKLYLEKLQMNLSKSDSNPYEHSTKLTQDILHHNELEKFTQSALSNKNLGEGINKAARDSIHSNSTAFFKGYRDAGRSNEV